MPADTDAEVPERAACWRVGTAGWALARDSAERFPGPGRHLERYARVLRCAEINSSFHRPHRAEQYARWAAQTSAEFRFAVKLPRSISHDARLRHVRAPLERFLGEAQGLGDRLAVILVQLPQSFEFDARPVRRFFDLLGERFGGRVACEPRHASWFTPAADRHLAAARVSRVAADPARVQQAATPGGWLCPHGDGAGALVYHRWHGATRMYWSRYEPAWITARAEELRRWPPQADVWCIFDNTASGAAIGNALELRDLQSKCMARAKQWDVL